MTSDHPGPPSPDDSYLAAVREEMARIEDADADLAPILEQVERAVAPYASLLTPEALDEARAVAAVAILAGPGLAALRGAPEHSGTRPKHDAGRLLDAAERRRDRRGGKAGA